MRVFWGGMTVQYVQYVLYNNAMAPMHAIVRPLRMWVARVASESHLIIIISFFGSLLPDCCTPKIQAGMEDGGLEWDAKAYC